MTRTTLAIAAVAWAALACSDRSENLITDPTAPDPSQPTQPAPSLATVTGRVVVIGERAVNLRTPDSALVRLVGSEAAALYSVNGADISVRGTWDANPGLVVHDFQVLAMKGRSAMDGILMLTDHGCALRVANGTLRMVPGNHDTEHGNIADYAGLRLWVIGSDTEKPIEFGVIAPTT